MKIILSLAVVLLLVGCRQKEVYFVFMGDRSIPSFEEVQIGSKVGDTIPMSVFSNHKGSSINIFWDGNKETEFNGEGGIVLSRKSGSLELNGLLKKEMYVYIIRGKPDASRGVVVSKSIIAPDQPFSYKKDLK